MIPSYQELMRPILETAKNEEVKLSSVTELLCEQFNLSEEEKTELLPSGRQATFINRVGWAKTYLTKAGLLNSTKRAHFVITSLGLKALKSDEEINNHYLKRFDDFKAFTKQKSNDTDKIKETDIPNNVATPDELLRASCKLINDAL